MEEIEIRNLPESELQNQTKGDLKICVAVLDGLVDQAHPCFAGASLTRLSTLVTGEASTKGSMSTHGTHIASIIFGQPGSPVEGIAPNCRGLIVPVFQDDRLNLSQLDLARAIEQAVNAGAHIINISGGQLTDEGEAVGWLKRSVQLCQEKNVLIVAAGRYKFLSDKDASGDLKNWVKQGGKIIAIDNAVAQMATGEWGIKMKKADEEKEKDKDKDKDKDKKDDPKLTYADLKKFAESEHDGIKSNIAGAIYKIDLDVTHPLSFGLGENYYTLKQDDNVYEFLKDGWNVGVIKKDNYVTGFVGSKIKDKIKDAMLIGEQSMGGGTIVYLADDPIFRNFWESGKLLLSNAVFLSGQ